METTEKAFAAAQSGYERGRVGWSVRSALPVLLIPLLSWGLSGRTESQFLLGAVLFGCVAVGLWRGRGWGRAIPIGLKAGLIPLVLSHAARLYGHVCTPAGCTTLCVPACVVGGVAAGLLAVRWSKGPRELYAAGAVSLLTGALGCACVGYSGVVGMLLGTGITVLGGSFALRIVGR